MRNESREGYGLLDSDPLPENISCICRYARTPLNAVDWDLVTSHLDRAFQKMFVRYKSKLARRYENEDEVNRMLGTYKEKMYVCIAPRNDEDRNLRNKIFIMLVRLSQKGNVLAERELVEWVLYVTSEWSDRYLQIWKWRGREDEVKLKKDGGICSCLGENFLSWFLAGEGKAEDAIPEGELRYGKLTKGSVDGPIIEELGGEAKAETTLTEVFDLMSKQSDGQEKEDGLLTNDWANIFYVRDTAGVLRAVHVYWDGGACFVAANSVGYPFGWRGGRRVFSRNS